MMPARKIQKRVSLVAQGGGHLLRASARMADSVHVLPVRDAVIHPTDVVLAADRVDHLIDAGRQMIALKAVPDSVISAVVRAADQVDHSTGASQQMIV